VVRAQAGPDARGYWPGESVFSDFLLTALAKKHETRTTAYERMCEGPVVAEPGSSSRYKRQSSAVRSILESRR
jgi:hypothetical protein